ncbi:hypothetical protein PCIT_b0217 [Pseudoalteromonas citrea]|uniref:Uncharacterized protein n=1 Tax=Pseudoalteromonas citrea TaxID=43655 RepID=A0AAD4AE46_9GAMM|nr:hypothetical protein PCIT_b0217 [Pseudoalteromonas citrea]
MFISHCQRSCTSSMRFKGGDNDTLYAKTNFHILETYLASELS